MSRMILMFTVVASTCFVARADVPQTINHQGVVKVNGQPFNGTGKFKFAILNVSGVNVWTNDGTNLVLNGVPNTFEDVTVTDGVYSVILGGTGPGYTMTTIAPGVFNEPTRRLRIWFDNGVNGPQQLTPDHELTSAPYAMQTPILAHSHNAFLLEQTVVMGTDIGNESHWHTIVGSTKSVWLYRGKTLINYAGGSFFDKGDGGRVHFRPFADPAAPGSDINGAIMYAYMTKLTGVSEEDEAYAGTVVVDIPADGTYTIGIEVYVTTGPTRDPKVNWSIQWTALSLPQ